ncbi:ATP-grasp domain-containing protein [Planctomyces sp. SH-PL14]|uniref:ATP-grasp domain-containing protein n=1 Tax=Planctomyces sp. SH-PL14 TaxID=1632864 RepID=UPI00078BC370|nr:ATP-grasp domain-containing protein [Planctomyces sp. SH-PL14]AMV16870.1 carbamoyl phosphate synthase-like protein [Planctomyces sp. SH-PL14]
MAERIFVSEFVCGGGWSEGRPPESLEREGRAMLLAVLADLAAVPGLRVVTTWDHRLARPLFPDGVEAVEVDSPQAEIRTFADLAAEATWTLVIAPETAGILSARVQAVHTAGGIALNGSVESIDLCGDKLRLAGFLRQRGIRTPAAALWDDEVVGELEGLRVGPDRWPWPVVAKPRDGAGSQQTRRVDGLMRGPSANLGWDELPQDPEFVGARENLLVQPWIAGRACSVAALVHPDGTATILPPAEQRFSEDGRMSYLGGTIPAEGVSAAAVESLVRSVLSQVPGLRGWIGFDFLVPADAPESVVLIEINPRLTTSYVGYRRICRGNLARSLVFGAESAPIFDGRITFSSDGTAILPE